MDASGRSLVRLPKILVGVACGNTDSPLEFERTFLRATAGSGKFFNAERMNVIGGVTDGARNDIVDKALANDYDFVYFMDMDMTFPDGALATMLLSTANIDNAVIAGVYNSRKDYRLHAYNWMPDQQRFRSITKEQDGFKLNNGLLKVDCAGTGCMLIECDVLRNMEWPYFTYHYDTARHERWSEDMVFCKKLYDAGIPVYLNTDVVCGHMQTFQIKQTDDRNYSIMEI